MVFHSLFISLAVIQNTAGGIHQSDPALQTADFFDALQVIGSVLLHAGGHQVRLVLQFLIDLRSQIIIHDTHDQTGAAQHDNQGDDYYP